MYVNLTSNKLLCLIEWMSYWLRMLKRGISIKNEVRKSQLLHQTF